jgi:hypothetical protein
MYDIVTVLSAKGGSTSGVFSEPSFSESTDVCSTKPLDLPALSENEFQSILKEPNRLWKTNFKGKVKAVSVGSTEAVVDEYASFVIESVANALKLDVRLERQTWIHGNRADHWVVRVVGDGMTGVLVGSEESKLPRQNYGPPYVLEDRRFLVQLRKQLMEVHHYYSTSPVFGIGCTGREWRFFKLPEKEALESPSTPKGKFPSNFEVMTPSWRHSNGDAVSNKDGSPPTTNIGPEDEGKQQSVDSKDEEGDMEKISDSELLASKVYKWDDPEMLRALGSVLKAMYLSQRKEVMSISEAALQDRIMWYLVQVPTQQPWGWAKLKVNRLKWHCMIRAGTTEVCVLCLLGRGADGKVFLVANKFGEVAAMKLVDASVGMEKALGNAKSEANNWNEIYGKELKKIYGNKQVAVRSEVWMGQPVVIMPRFNQFVTKEEREQNLGAVRKCLEKYFGTNFVHEDVAWRNIGYTRRNGDIHVVLLDLASARVKRRSESKKPDNWIDTAMEALKGRVELK